MKFKKIISYILLLVFLIPLNFTAFAENSAKPSVNFAKSGKLALEDLPAKSYILIDFNTGQVLYEKNADEALPIASITKIMTMFLVVEAVEEKKISLEDMVTATENARPSNSESSLWLEVGEKMSVRDLLKAVAVNSCNDAARTLAEFLAGSEESFVDLMNKKAEELKMKNTNFVNASGLDSEDHYSSARDIAILTKELLKYRWILNYTSIVKGTLRNGNYSLKNTNQLLQIYKGCNGLKTGYTEEAGKCLCATATKNNINLCAVSLGSATTEERTQTCTALLDYGFSNFQTIKVDEKAIEEKQIPVKKGKKPFVGCECKNNNFSCLIKKVDARKIKEEFKIEDSVMAPVEKGQVLGYVDYIGADNKKIFTKEIIASEEVKKIDFLYLFSGMIKSFFTGISF